MLRTGLKETQSRENNNEKVHPQPMKETTNQNPEPMETMILEIFNKISSLKAAYIQLQIAHKPYDPDKIQAADELVVEELKQLSLLKHSYRKNHIKPISTAPLDSRVLSEIQEQHNMLKTNEIMLKKLESQLATRESEIVQLQQQIHESSEENLKLVKKLKQRDLQSKEREGSQQEPGSFSVELTPSLFSSAVDMAYKSIHDFAKPLINMMKASGWDLDEAAKSIDPAVVYARRAHKKYAFESDICRKMFIGFQEESFSIEGGNLDEGFFHQFLATRDMDPLDMLGQSPDSVFGKFCRKKYLLIVHPKMEAAFFGNLDGRKFVMNGLHPRTPFYQSFVKLAKSIWLLHRLAYSFDPRVKIFQVRRGTDYSEVYMESVVKNLAWGEGDERPKVELMVMPGFMTGASAIQSQVYLTGVKPTD